MGTAFFLTGFRVLRRGTTWEEAFVSFDAIGFLCVRTVILAFLSHFILLCVVALMNLS